MENVDILSKELSVIHVRASELSQYSLSSPSMSLFITNKQAVGIRKPQNDIKVGG